ncbi:hypothetical protein DHU27_24675 [Salmonella enterica]|nr:hypothetical protein [Salmonella enterica]
MKKRIGDVQYYLDLDVDIFHLVKRIKTFSKEFTQGKTKATTLTVSDIHFTKKNFNNINFNENGLREKDKEILIKMIEEMDNDD